MTYQDNPLKLTETWFSVGIMTPERLNRFREEWAHGDDKHPEHFRWRAFLEFVAERRPLEPQTAAALYELGERDLDVTMGGSMMACILRLPECPAVVIEAALRSKRKHLVKIASRSLASGYTG